MTDAPNGHDPYRQYDEQYDPQQDTYDDLPTDPRLDPRYPPRSHRAPKRSGVAGPILAALVVLGLLVGTGWYFTRDGKGTVATGQDEPLTVATESATDPASSPAAPSTTPTSTPSRTPSATPSKTPSRTPREKPSATPTRSTTAPSRSSTRPPKPAPKPTRTTTTSRPPTSEPTTAKPTTTEPTADGGSVSREAQVLQLTNVERQKAGCQPLRTNSALTRAAEAHAADMVDNHYFDHTSLDGRSPFDRMKAAGFTGGAMAENIAAGYSTAAAVVEGWMDSSGHRRNILNCDYTMIGIGYDAGTIKPEWGSGSWVQNFGG